VTNVFDLLLQPMLIKLWFPGRFDYVHWSRTHTTDSSGRFHSIWW